MSRNDCPPDAKQKECANCEYAPAEVDGLCGPCACADRIDNDDLRGAFDLASEHGVDVVAVGMMIQSLTEHRVRAEVRNAAHRATAAIHGARVPANDNVIENVG